MSNLLKQAINFDDGDAPSRSSRTRSASYPTIANYCFPKTWPADREQRARIIGEWLQTAVRFLAA
jgi:hypothetical protein